MSLTYPEWSEHIAAAIHHETEGNYHMLRMHLRSFTQYLMRNYNPEEMAEVLTQVDWLPLLKVAWQDNIDEEREQEERYQQEMVSCTRCMELYPRHVLHLTRRAKVRGQDYFCDACLLKMKGVDRQCVWCEGPFIVASPDSTAILCPDCRIMKGDDEQRRLSHNLIRAQESGETATLTMKEWERAIFDFHGKCAYCQACAFEILEHFIPIGRGKGTTADNCVPACFKCNQAKAYGNLPKEQIERVRAYLATR